MKTTHDDHENVFDRLMILVSDIFNTICTPTSMNCMFLFLKHLNELKKHRKIKEELKKKHTKQFPFDCSSVPMVSILVVLD